MGYFSPDRLFVYFARLIVLFTSMPVHEFAHGWVADKLGDHTARYQGRLDLNPLAHLDPLGTILILFTGFGWAKPVPVNPSKFNRKITMRAGMALTSLAGPAANVLMATILLLVYKIIALVLMLMNVPMGNAVQIVTTILSMMVTINVSLAVFNLLPVPPLDGYHILAYFLPARWEYLIAQYSRYIFLGLFAVMMFTNILSLPLTLLSNVIYRFLDFITGFVDVLANMLL
ncbi:site-2 protease family protein [Marasmitruncus massiliensis]|jgi:Zn-dependent protease|uniref:site-2 protease family protein n=1 Tax=Marasmitruncus massiliensis TaxID=1944642 RepID=UPI001FA9027F|nr:site-2 protease family protein [Marasmitruncus massiliensis]